MKQETTIVTKKIIDGYYRSLILGGYFKVDSLIGDTVLAIRLYRYGSNGSKSIQITFKLYKYYDGTYYQVVTELNGNRVLESGKYTYNESSTNQLFKGEYPFILLVTWSAYYYTSSYVTQRAEVIALTPGGQFTKVNKVFENYFNYGLVGLEILIDNNNGALFEVNTKYLVLT